MKTLSLRNDRVEASDTVVKALHYVSLWLLLLKQVWAQRSTAVSGQVTDDKKESLPGVSVVVKESQTGTVTDANGRYTLNAASNGATLVFSFIGYVSQEVPIGGRSTVDVKLVTDVKSLNEVVVVGYGTSARATLPARWRR